MRLALGEESNLYVQLLKVNNIQHGHLIIRMNADGKALEFENCVSVQLMRSAQLCNPAPQENGNWSELIQVRHNFL